MQKLDMKPLPVCTPVKVCRRVLEVRVGRRFVNSVHRALKGAGNEQRTHREGTKRSDEWPFVIRISSTFCYHSLKLWSIVAHQFVNNK